LFCLVRQEEEAAHTAHQAQAGKRPRSAMRTPGRCRNFETCWLANGRRDIRVAVGDPFVCPACGEPLLAPSIDSISTNGILGALAVSLALVATAGGAGFGIVRLAQTASHSLTAALQPHHANTGAVAQNGSGSPTPVPPKPETLTVATIQLRPEPIVEARMIQLADAVPTLDINASVPAAVYVAALPPHPLQLPISFGRPQPPEDDAPARSPRWHHHSSGAPEHTYIESSPAFTPADSDAVTQASQSVPQAQGDGDYDSAAVSAPEMAQDVVPAQQAPTSAPVQDTRSIVPAQQADTAVPSAIDVSGAYFDGEPAPSQITRMIVPAAASAPYEAADPVAERVDPKVAASLDKAPDAPYRLATLPPAPADKLAVPSYPPRKEALDQPGRVDVGCLITPRGVPSDCQVQKQIGGHSFSHSVLAWLNGGSVRYRPGVVAGHPVAEPRNYQVKFEP
jgi:hypothetical protein